MSDPTRYESDIRDLIKTVARMEAKIDSLGNVREIAIEAQQSSKSAHLRIDRLDKVVNWAGTTIIGALIVGAITLLYQNRG